MTGNDVTVETLRVFQEYHWLMLRVYHDAAVERFGEAGAAAVRVGARDCGRYRGQRQSDRPESFASGRDAGALVRDWETAEWELAHVDGVLAWSGTATDLSLELDEAPGAAYLRSYGSSAAADLYWPEFLAGFAETYDAGCTITTTGSAASGPWSVRIVCPEAAPEPARPGLGGVLDDQLRLVQMARNTSGLIAALQMYVSRELVRRFDAAGEETVRQAAYAFGSERGSVIRAKHLAAGIPVTMASFASAEGLQERDPSEAVFVFSKRQHVSAGAYYLDCTYCPLQEVWAHEGAEGLRLGYLFDASNHRGLFQSYHPETVVRWDAVKSRGDSICKFRFTVPSLLTEDDPTPEEYDAAR